MKKSAYEQCESPPYLGKGSVRAFEQYGQMIESFRELFSQFVTTDCVDSKMNERKRRNLTVLLTKDHWQHGPAIQARIEAIMPERYDTFTKGYRYAYGFNVIYETEIAKPKPTRLRYDSFFLDPKIIARGDDASKTHTATWLAAHIPIARSVITDIGCAAFNAQLNPQFECNQPVTNVMPATALQGLTFTSFETPPTNVAALA